MNEKIYKFYVPVKLNQEQSEKLNKLGDLLNLTQSKALRYLIDHADIKTITEEQNYQQTRITDSHRTKLKNIAEILGTTETDILQLAIDSLDVKAIMQEQHQKVVEKFRADFGREPTAMDFALMNSIQHKLRKPYM